MFGLIAHLIHKIGTEYCFRESWEVLYFRRVHKLTAGRQGSCNNEWSVSSSAKINGGGVTCGSGPYNNGIMNSLLHNATVSIQDDRIARVGRKGSFLSHSQLSSGRGRLFLNHGENRDSSHRNQSWDDFGAHLVYAPCRSVVAEASQPANR